MGPVREILKRDVSHYNSYVKVIFKFFFFKLQKI